MHRFQGLTGKILLVESSDDVAERLRQELRKERCSFVEHIHGFGPALRRLQARVYDRVIIDGHVWNPGQAAAVMRQAEGFE